MVCPGLQLGDADHAGVLAFFGEHVMQKFVLSKKERAATSRQRSPMESELRTSSTPRSNPRNAASGWMCLGSGEGDSPSIHITGSIPALPSAELRLPASFSDRLIWI